MRVITYRLFNSKGVTLIECVVALALAGIALSAALTSMMVLSSAPTRLGRRAAVVSKLRQTIEEIKLTEHYSDIHTENHNNFTIDDRDTPADNSDDLISDTFFTNVDTIEGEDYRRVTVVMRWSEDRGGSSAQFEESLETFISNHWW